MARRALSRGGGALAAKLFFSAGPIRPQVRTGVVDVQSDIHPTSAFVARGGSHKNGPARNLSWERRPRREAFASAGTIQPPTPAEIPRRWHSVRRSLARAGSRRLAPVAGPGC